jgi:hypothetical protein
MLETCPYCARPGLFIRNICPNCQRNSEVRLPPEKVSVAPALPRLLEVVAAQRAETAAAKSPEQRHAQPGLPVPQRPFRLWYLVGAALLLFMLFLCYPRKSFLVGPDGEPGRFQAGTQTFEFWPNGVFRSVAYGSTLTHEGVWTFRGPILEMEIVKQQAAFDSSATRVYALRRFFMIAFGPNRFFLDMEHKPFKRIPSSFAPPPDRDTTWPVRPRKPIPLMTAVEGNRPAEVARLLAKYPASVNHPNHDGNPALVQAVFSGNIPISELLLQRGANPNATNGNGVPVLSIALMHQQRKAPSPLVGLLLKHGADANLRCARDGATPLHAALLQGDVDTVETLLRHGANPNLPSCNGQTPLEIATDKHPDFTKALFAHGATNNSSFRPPEKQTNSPIPQGD